MILKVLFWLVVLIDAAALGLTFVLGLAAAGPSKTNPLSVLLFFAVPALVLLGAVVLFLRAQSTGLRGLAFLLAASPMIFVGVQMVQSAWTLVSYQTAEGRLRYLRSGAAQQLETAIERNDLGTVQQLLRQGVNVNERGRDNQSFLEVALRQMRQTPEKQEVLRVLLQAGADPNAGGEELPLTMAIQVSGKTGAAPVKLLLERGANPNAITEFGDPVWFGATGITVPKEVLALVLNKGADIKAKARSGNNALATAAAAQNWPALLALLQKGADPKLVRTPMGQGLLEKLESDLRTYGDKGGLEEAIAAVKAAAI